MSPDEQKHLDRLLSDAKIQPSERLHDYRLRTERDLNELLPVPPIDEALKKEVEANSRASAELTADELDQANSELQKRNDLQTRLAGKTPISQYFKWIMFASPGLIAGAFMLFKFGCK